MGKWNSTGTNFLAQSLAILRQNVVFPIPGFPSTSTILAPFSPFLAGLKISYMWTSFSVSWKQAFFLHFICNLV